MKPFEFENALNRGIGKPDGIMFSVTFTDDGEQFFDVKVMTSTGLSVSISIESSEAHKLTAADIAQMAIDQFKVTNKD